VAVNVAIKIMLMDTYGVVGLAIGTAAGIWVNLVLLVILATRRDWMAPSAQLGRILAAIAAATVLLALFAWFAPPPLRALTATLPRWHSEILLALAGVKLARR
jgi:putative peptidoglycan lipid II flippase